MAVTIIDGSPAPLTAGAVAAPAAGKYADLRTWFSSLPRSSRIVYGVGNPRIIRSVLAHIGTDTVMSVALSQQYGNLLPDGDGLCSHFDSFLDTPHTGPLGVLPWHMQGRPRTVRNVAAVNFERNLRRGHNTVQVKIPVSPQCDWNEYVILHMLSDAFGEGTWFGFLVNSTESFLLRWGAGSV